MLDSLTQWATLLSPIISVIAIIIAYMLLAVRRKMRRNKLKLFDICLMYLWQQIIWIS